MNKLFSYDSPIMQILGFIADLIILNVLFLFCCVPLFTIGAAQAGLHTGVKVLLDKDDESSYVAAFFRGFSSGFGTVTLSWGLLSVLLLLVAWAGLTAIAIGGPTWLIVLAIAICALFQTIVPLFHARFSCTAWQLVRNAWFLLFAHPLRSIASVALVWGPAILFLLGDLYTFMNMTPFWVTLYYSSVFCAIHTLMKKPFKTLIDHFNQTHGITPAAEAEAEEVAELPE